MKYDDKLGVEPTIVISASRWGECQFFADWFDRAQRATDYLEQLREDQFFKAIDHLEVVEQINFRLDAIALAASTRPYPTILRLRSDLGDAFGRLFTLGFVVYKAGYWDFDLPQVTIGSIRKALVDCVETENEDSVLNAEFLVKHMLGWEAALFRHWLAKAQRKTTDGPAVMPRTIQEALEMSTQLNSV